MLDFIHLYDDGATADYNESFLRSENDIPIEDLVVMTMKEFEAVENIEILGYTITKDPDDIDINYHSININYKRKNPVVDVPKYKYTSTNRVGSIDFKIRIHTNLHERIIHKKILIPLEYDGVYTLNNKSLKAYWQLCDESTYSQRGRITLKSRMPIIIYYSKKRLVIDAFGTVHELSSYSYALNSKTRRGAPKARVATKARVKFINPLMIFAAKIGLHRTIQFFELDKAIKIVTEIGDDTDIYDYFYIDDVIFKVDRYVLENVQFVGAFVGMMYNLRSNEFPLTYQDIDNFDYWKCRIGYIGAAKSKNLYTFLEKGRTTIFMIERLTDTISEMLLRLPDIYKCNVYYILRWMITDFSSIKAKNNMDLNNKRIRKNEYIVRASLGKKVSEILNKLIEKKSKSKLNTIETLLEMFNFGSDIIINGMRNIGDLIKSDEIVNDLTWVQDLYFSSKGPNSIGEKSPKRIPMKYRSIHPSYVGKLSLNVSSNSDVGMSGAFTPFVKLYDRFYFSPEHEPCDAMYNIQSELAEYYNSPNCQVKGCEMEWNFNSPEEYIKFVSEHTEWPFDGLQYEKIEIVEREPDATAPASTFFDVQEMPKILPENDDDHDIDETEDGDATEAQFDSESDSDVTDSDDGAEDESEE